MSGAGGVLVPGAMEHQLRREFEDGWLDFESAPVGWLRSNGAPRKAPWRAYYFTPRVSPSEGIGGARERLPSTSTILDAICPRELKWWAEAKGIEGAHLGHQIEGLSVNNTVDEAIHWVRENDFGMEAATRRASERGLNIHDLLRVYMETGRAPRIDDHPVHHRGFIEALCGWLAKRNPEPVAVEQLVVHRGYRYAGRLDLRANINGRLLTIDAKTQENAGIYRAAHWQVNLYEQAARYCGDGAADYLLVVVFAADGQYREMPVDFLPIGPAMDFYKTSQPIDYACEVANKAEKSARS